MGNWKIENTHSHIPSYLFHAHAIFPLTRPCSSVSMIRFVVEKIRFCKFVGLSSSACSVLFHIDYLRQESFLHVKGNQGGDESCPSTLRWCCLHISLHFFSVIFLHTQQGTMSKSLLVCFVLFLNYFFLYFLTSDTRQLDYLISGNILMAHKYFFL